MPEYRRLPRKLKKELKKNPEEWATYLKKKKESQERSESLDIIFTRNYKHNRKIFRKMIKTGKM